MDIAASIYGKRTSSDYPPITRIGFRFHVPSGRSVPSNEPLQELPGWISASVYGQGIRPDYPMTRIGFELGGAKYGKILFKRHLYKGSIIITSDKWVAPPEF